MANLDNSEIMRTAAEGRAEDLRETLRRKSLQSLYFFAKTVLGYKDLAPSCHLEFCDHLQKTISQLKRGYLLPRGHFKSSVGKSYTLWRLIGGGLDPDEIDYSNPDKDPRNIRVLIVGESGPVAEKNLRDIKWHLENNQMLKWLFPEICPTDVGNTKWTESEVLLPRTKTFDESTITCMGVGGRGTGFHYDLIIYDDIIGFDASQSESKMQLAIDWYGTAPGLLNDQETGEEVMFGTRWKHGKADLYGYIMETMPNYFSWFIRSAIDSEGNVYFPERFTQEKLDLILDREKAYKFSCQYMNRPSTPEGADFPETWIKFYDITRHPITGQLNLIVPRDGTAPVTLSKLLRLSFYDPSPGGKSATAENAIVVAGMDSLRRIFFLKAWSRNCSYGAAIEQWHHFNDQFVCYSNFYEMVGAQKEIEELVAQRRFMIVCPYCPPETKKPHRRLNPLPVKPPGTSGVKLKEERIRTYAQSSFEEGRVYLGPGMQELVRQITSFPHGDLVDIFDAGAYCIHLLRPPMSDDDIEAEKADEQARRDAQVQRTSCEHAYGGYI